MRSVPVALPARRRRREESLTSLRIQMEQTHVRRHRVHERLQRPTLAVHRSDEPRQRRSAGFQTCCAVDFQIGAARPAALAGEAKRNPWKSSITRSSPRSGRRTLSLLRSSGRIVFLTTGFAALHPWLLASAPPELELVYERFQRATLGVHRSHEPRQRSGAGFQPARFGQARCLPHYSVHGKGKGLLI